MARNRGDAARVIEGVETTGYGCSATWKGGRVVTTPTVTETRRAGQTNERVELARYTVSAGERVIHGQRVLGVVRLVDEPASGDGPPLRHRARADRRWPSSRRSSPTTSSRPRRWDVIPAAGSCPLLAEREEAER